MSDHELLRLSAKAAGIELEYCDVSGLHWVTSKYSGLWWDPLHVDGDAFRLAVKLKLDISFFDGFGEVHAGGDGIISASCENYSEDMNAVTRKAIVNAAAVIGRSMP